MDDDLKITQSGFFTKFIARHKERPDRPFCFVLGAGASKSSGIPTGQELARKWIKEIHEENNFDNLPFESWATPERLKKYNIVDFSLERAAEYYPQIYNWKFHNQPEDGYACLEKIMEHVEPSYGYSVLSYILSKTIHKVVITTNFDNLVADALFLHSDTFPRIVGHDQLVEYIRPEVRRPLIAKIHGDRGFATKNSPEDIRCLAGCWTKALEDIFRKYTPIFIGYAGNDGSLMGFLEHLPDGVPDTMFWCYRRGDAPTSRVNELVKKEKGKFIEIEGFDEMMLRLQKKAKEALEFPDLLKNLKKRSDSIVKGFKKQQNDLIEAIARADQQEYLTDTIDGISAKPEQKKEESLLDVAVKTLGGTAEKKSWWEWWNEIKSQNDVKSKDAKFKEALTAWPKNVELIGSYADFLFTITKNYNQAEKYYKQAIDINPKYARILGNYAIFLHEIRKDYDQAEKYYKQAIDVDPKYANSLGNYATFLSNIRKDHDQAEKYYKQAIDADPKNVKSLGNYATFLHGTRKDYNLAEKYYKQAIDVDPKNANSLGNYAQLLFITNKTEKAKEFLQYAEENVASDILNVRIELAFYRYAHIPENRSESLCQLRKLLEQGARSPGWSLDANIEKAIQDGHPEPELLPVLVKVINDVAPIESLEQFRAYIEAKS